MSEPLSKNLGGKNPASPTLTADKPPVVPAVASAVPVQLQPMGKPVSPPAQPPAAFGGHRGGGKKRTDGLVAGSPEAREADRKKDADRKAEKRAEKKVAALPPTLPGVAVPPANAAAPVVAGASGEFVPALPAVGVAAALPMFVAWSEKVLARPIKLLTKIVDRFRCSALMLRVRKLGLTPPQEKEIEAEIKYKQEVVDDFNAALTTCVVVELNKRRVPGAEHSHWLDVAMTGGELVLTHLNTVDKLEKMIAENAAKNQLPAAGGEPKLN